MFLSRHQAQGSLEKIQRAEQNNNHCEALKRSGQSKISIRNGFMRFMGLIFLFCFAFSSVGEAKHLIAPRQVGAANKTIERPTIRKEPDVALVRKHPQRISEARGRPQASMVRARSQVSRSRARPQVSRSRGRAPVSRSRGRPQVSRASARGRFQAPRGPQRVGVQTRQPRATAVRTGAPRATAARTRVQPNRRIVAQNRPSLPVNRRRGIQTPIQPPPPVQPPPTYFSLLSPHTQQNARLGGFDHLYAKGYYGTGTVAVIEFAGDWDEMLNIVHNNHGTLPPQIRENYKNNFLPPIGGPGFNPNVASDFIRLTHHGRGDLNHGSEVASVVLTLSRAKVLPRSTYRCTRSGLTYDIADVLMDLSTKTDVNIINISCGYVKSSTTSIPNPGGVPGTLDASLYKDTYPPKRPGAPTLVEAFQAVANAGKVVVMGAGNEGEDMQPIEFATFKKQKNNPYIQHLLEVLDEKTRRAIIVAGALNPNTNALSSYSSRPGHWAAAQKSFVCASGEWELPYKPGVRVRGTSYAGPEICAGIANLCSIPGVTPQRAARAVMGSADPGLDPKQYGRGRMNLKRAEGQIRAGWY